MHACKSSCVDGIHAHTRDRGYKQRNETGLVAIRIRVNMKYISDEIRTIFFLTGFTIHIRIFFVLLDCPLFLFALRQTCLRVCDVHIHTQTGCVHESAKNSHTLHLRL